MGINKVLNIEDTVLKHAAISRALKKAGIPNVDLASNAEDGIAMIEEAIKSGESYELLVTDMIFPINSNDKEESEAGMYVIEKLKEKNIELPIVMCSSGRYRIPEIERCIFYNERSGDLDGDISRVVNDLRTKEQAKKVLEAREQREDKGVKEDEVVLMAKEAVRQEVEKLRKMDISLVGYDYDKKVIYEQHSDGTRTEICKSKGVSAYLDKLED